MKTWVKLYTEINRDADMGTLTWAQRGIWAALLALAGEIDDREGEEDAETGRLDTLERIAWHLRCDLGELEEAVAAFVERGMVEEREGVLYLPNYAKRQGRAVSARRNAVAQRVREHRGRQAEQRNEDVTPLHDDVTSVKRGVTSSDSDPDPDTESDADPESTPPGGGTDGFAPLTTGNPPRQPTAAQLRLKAMETHFSERTDYPLPARETAAQRKEGGALWWGPLREILRLVDDDVGRGESLIDATIAYMRERGWEISDPKSIIRTARKVASGNALARASPSGNGRSTRAPVAPPGLTAADERRNRIAMGELPTQEEDP